MPLSEALRLALQAIWGAKLRSFFTLLGIIVSVGFLVVVVAVIQGMNAYVKENLTGAVVGTNAFQVRRSPIAVGLMDDAQVRAIAKRPLISAEDAAVVLRALPDAQAVALQSGWPTPINDVSYRDRTVGNVLIFGVTPPYQIVQDYQMLAGVPLTDPDMRERRPVAVIGYEIAEKLFDQPAAAVGKKIRIAGREVLVTGVIAEEGPGAGPVVRRLPAPALLHVRVVLRPAEDDRGLGQDGERRCRGPRDGACRGGHADRAPAPARRGERLHGGQGRCAGGVLAPAHPGAVHRHSGRRVRRNRGRRHRDHEHHADERQRADPRDRPAQVARRPPRATFGASS